MIDFEWDPSKARKNLRKHGVAFREGATVLRDPLAITMFDPDHSGEEDRYITVGSSNAGREPASSAREKSPARSERPMNLVLLEPDVAEVFPTEEAVNKPFAWSSS